MTDTINNLTFRAVRPTDMDQCYALEKASYPTDEAASKTTLQFRQHHAARYFRCAVLQHADEGEGPTEGDGEGVAEDLIGGGETTAITATMAAPSPNSGNSTNTHHSHENEDSDDDKVIGFICSTLCREFTLESMQNHVPAGPLLAIHSVVVDERFRRKGIATKMLQDYIQFIQDSNAERITPIEKFVLLAKRECLAFYINCGFSVIGKSCIEHGTEQWYHLERVLPRAHCESGLSCYIVNAFAEPNKQSTTRTNGSGNPAAVVVLPADHKVDLESEDRQAWMQTVAAQFNLSETAFVQRKSISGQNKDGCIETDSMNLTTSEDDAAHFDIRFYTPTTQIALCGHATLASAAVLFKTLILPESQAPICFHALDHVVLNVEKSLLLPGTNNNSRHSSITMKFPIKPPLEIEDEDARREIMKMLQVALEVNTDTNDDCILFIGFTDLGDLLVELTYESFIQIDGGNEHSEASPLSIDYKAFSSYDGYTRGVIVCCQAPPTSGHEEEEVSIASDVTFDFYSRFFAPKAGISEDPVTGSAHASLAPYFAKKLAKDKVTGMQMSRRGGIVDCQLLWDDGTVDLTGLAVIVMRGEVFL
ncbi:hypothetical protein MPSEU_000044100 [Mayamaea pseudoterrestris]|nr:hypothetical protein MPSEU_000044100 [Mayamaea pseudoterrestris]